MRTALSKLADALAVFRAAVAAAAAVRARVQPARADLARLGIPTDRPLPLP